MSAMPGCAFQGGGVVAPGHESSPMNCVAWSEADSYCRMTSGALPTEAQWEFAATNGGATRFPWGDEAPTEFRETFAVLGRAGWQALVADLPQDSPWRATVGNCKAAPGFSRSATP